MAAKSADPGPVAAGQRAGASASLVHNDAQYRALVEAIEDCAVFMLDLEGCVISWNAGAQKIKGYAAQEILGEHFSRFYTAESLAREWPQYELTQALARGRFEDEGWRVRKDGSLFWANVVITTMHDEFGKPFAFVKMTRDLTARRQEEEQLRQSEERFRLLVESVKDYAIFMLDPLGVVTSWNPGAINIKGYLPQEIIGRHFSVFYDADDIAAGKPERELVQATQFGRIEDEGWRMRKDGSRFWANVVITAIYDAKHSLRGFAKVTRDMSERKRREELEESSQLITEFLATLAHELRNPLAPVRNTISVMQLESDISPTLVNCRDMIDRQITHLTRLVDDLLDMGRITTGKIELRLAPLDVADMVMRGVEGARPLAAARGQRIDIELASEPLSVRGDLTRLVQVLHNLLNNASKFSPAGSCISVGVAAEDRTVVLRVRDAGRGIPAAALDKIFNLFVQEDRHLTSAESGLGLGLTLCRSLVELHGGAILAASAGLNQGSTFTIRLPSLAMDHAELPAPAGRPQLTTAADSDLRVLIIDDNRDSADSLAMLIDLMGYPVRVAYDGARALEAAKEFMPHLALIDLAMPDIDGFGVLLALRAQPVLAQTLFAAMTGYGQQSDRQRSIKAGFDMHMVKPVELKLLEDLLAQAQQRRRASA